MKSLYLVSIQTVIALLLFAGNVHSAPADLTWPEITSETKAWSRWWWLGSILDKEGLTTEMEKYAAAGLGGLEITPIYGVKGYEDRFLNYLTPEWVEMLEYTLSEAERLDMKIDMATGNGWPFGGPWVTPSDACKDVLFKTYTLKGGESLKEQVTYIQETMARAEGHRISIDDLTDPVSSNPNQQQLALVQVRFARDLPLHALMAYSSDGEVLDLMDKVGDDHVLNWTAPDGDWTLYAVFQGWHGKQVERAGPGGEGDVIDHFSKRALKDYLGKFDEAYKGHHVDTLRAYFNDSYEVDDAAGESNWTDNFLDEFEQRRGYDLRQHFPALFARDDSEESLRVKCDYRETISDLLLEEFTIPWREWAKTHNAKIRNQAHGSPANILDLYAASSIPETEGRDVFKFKFASSAAHVVGKQITACEASTWLNEHFTSTLADVKQNVDDYFLGGVNHIVYHGTPYSPPEAGYPGWMFYASVHFGTTNSFWDHFSALNGYVARVQSFMQKGKAVNDVLLYFPFHDAISVSSRSTLVHFSGQGNGRSASEKIAATLYDRGFSFDHISDRQAAKLEVRDGAIVTGGVAYQALVIPETHYMPLDTWKKIINLVKQGATVVVQNQLPSDVPGLGDLKARQKRLAQLNGQIRFDHSSADIQKIMLGKGSIYEGKEIDTILLAAGVRREMLTDLGLECIRRRDGSHDYYFIVNRSGESISQWVPLATEAQSAAIFDPVTGKSGRAGWHTGFSEVYLQLDDGQSCIVKTFDRTIDDPMFLYTEPSGDAIAISSGWSLTFVKGGPEIPPTISNSSLGSWTQNDGDAYKNFSGTATYSTAIAKPDGSADGWILDLGRVAESAKVLWNGQDLGTLICPPFRIVIEKEQIKASNKLEISVANLMANRMADLSRRDSSWKKFYNINFPARERRNRGEDGLFTAANWEPRESGLIGPVRLIPYKRLSVNE